MQNAEIRAKVGAGLVGDGSRRDEYSGSVEAVVDGGRAGALGTDELQTQTQSSVLAKSGGSCRHEDDSGDSLRVQTAADGRRGNAGNPRRREDESVATSSRQATGRNQAGGTERNGRDRHVAPSECDVASHIAIGGPL